MTWRSKRYNHFQGSHECTKPKIRLLHSEIYKDIIGNRGYIRQFFYDSCASKTQSCRHIGHFRCSADCAPIHLEIQCKWNGCLQTPQTIGHSSPGTLQSGQQPSNALRHIPHESSPASHVHAATSRTFCTVIFIFASNA